jgi:hypothetical protein
VGTKVTLTTSSGESVTLEGKGSVGQALDEVGKRLEKKKGKARAADKAERKYEVIPEGEPPYRILNEVLRAHHSALLCEARIVLVWTYGVKPDRDGVVWWGKVRKVGELEREFHAHDFAILLNATAWGALPESAHRALLDHELSHCGAEVDDAGDTKYFLRKHDLEEFNNVVRRHGLWREGVKVFVDAALKREQKGLFDPADAADAIDDAEVVKGGKK